MSEAARMWVEIVFNISYLVVVWGLVALMTRDQGAVLPRERILAGRLRWMFILLALGDTGHVGFRVLGYALGGLEANPVLVGLGALATAVTITFFYMLLVDVWRLRFKQKLGWFGIFLLAAGGIRLVIMLLPGNSWGSVTPPEPMGIIRNIPLMIQGLGVMVLILRDAFKAGDRTFQWVGGMIFTSYLFYTPVIFFVNQAPLLGMLMIPKTLAYVAIAVIVYRTLFHHPRSVTRTAASQA